jgi:hypothetical protein
MSVAGTNIFGRGKTAVLKWSTGRVPLLQSPNIFTEEKISLQAP